MKKIFAILLTVAMLATMSVTAFAATNEGGDTTIDISATFKAGSAAADVVSVDIEWGTMTFEYVEGSEGTWNPKTHEHDGSTEAKWSQSGNSITLTNHSDVGVKATFTYEKAVDSVTGTFDQNEFALATAEGTTFENAPKDTVTLTLGGTLTAEDAGKVGTVTISIAENQ